MTMVTIKFGKESREVEASNPNVAAKALMLALEMPADSKFQAELGRAVAAGLGIGAFVPIPPGRTCVLPEGEISKRLVSACGGGVEQVAQDVGRKRVCFRPGDAVPTSTQVSSWLNDKKLAHEILAQDVWISTTGGEYQIISSLKPGSSGTIYVVARNGVSYAFKTTRSIQGYAEERAALQALLGVAGVIQLVGDGDGLIILPKAVGDIEKWTADERTVLEAFRPLADALAHLLEQGRWHDDLHARNVLRFDVADLRFIDISGDKGDAPKYLQNVREFVDLIQSRIADGKCSQAVGDVLALARTGDVPTIVDLRQRLWK